MSMIGPVYRSDACAKAVVQKSTQANFRNMCGKIAKPVGVAISAVVRIWDQRNGPLLAVSGRLLPTEAV